MRGCQGFQAGVAGRGNGVGQLRLRQFLADGPGDGSKLSVSEEATLRRFCQLRVSGDQLFVWSSKAVRVKPAAAPEKRTAVSPVQRCVSTSRGPPRRASIISSTNASSR